MKLKLMVVIVLLCAIPLSADEPVITAAAIEQAATAPAQEDPPPGVEPSEAASEPEAPAEPSAEELASRVESFGEAFTELKNVVDALSRMKLSGYLQAQYVNDQSSVNELSGAAATRNKDQFSIRRARVKFTYQAHPTARFVLQPDITSSGVTLKDGYVELTEPWTTWKHTLTAGQFNWPFGFEIAYSSSSREMPERTRVVRTLFPGERDRGLMLSGVGLQERFKYQVAIVNGTGTSQSFDFNKRKDVVGRVAYSFGALDLGASLYRGEDLVATRDVAKGVEFSKQRQGVEFQWVTPIQGLGVRGEYITGRQAPASGTTRTDSHDVDGWYLYAIQNVGTRHQFVARLEQYDPDTDVGDNSTSTLGGSYIFHWDAHSKVMLAYEAPELEAADPDDNVFTLRYQYSF